MVTAAAVIMFAVFAAFVPEGDASLKPIALGLAVGIVIDAFVVRMTLVPAVMALLGEKAWWMPRWLDRVLPHFDIEGEAVERELALADWPEPDTTAAVVGRGPRGAPTATSRSIEACALRVERGDVARRHGAPIRAAPRALLLTIAGRVAPTEGRLRVAGHLLPERAAWVRAHVGVALLDGSARSRSPRLRRAAPRAHRRILVIDGVDALAAGRRRATAPPRCCATRHPPTVLVSAVDPAVAQALLAEAGRPSAPVLDSDRPRPSAPHSRRGALS